MQVPDGEMDPNLLQEPFGYCQRDRIAKSPLFYGFFFSSSPEALALAEGFGAQWWLARGAAD